MARNRQKSKENKRREQALNTKNEYGNMDLTPYQAIQNIRKKKGSI